MPIEHVTDTALWVAHYRATESTRPDALFHDPLAGVPAGERGQEIARSMPGGVGDGGPYRRHHLELPSQKEEVDWRWSYKRGMFHVRAFIPLPTSTDPHEPAPPLVRRQLGPQRSGVQ